MNGFIAWVAWHDKGLRARAESAGVPDYEAAQIELRWLFGVFRDRAIESYGIEVEGVDLHAAQVVA